MRSEAGRGLSDEAGGSALLLGLGSLRAGSVAERRGAND